MNRADRKLCELRAYDAECAAAELDREIQALTRTRDWLRQRSRKLREEAA